MEKTVLILGASGRFGRNSAQAFAKAGWTVRTFDRSRDNLDRASAGVQVIVAGWNPPYHLWAEQVPTLHAQVRRVALQNDATVILPGNVYVYGPQAARHWDAQTPRLAKNPLGRIRIEMERAYRRDGVRTILLRAGDYLDTEASGNWFDKILAPGLKKGVFTYPGRPDVMHAWAFLPDVARAAVALAEKRDALDRFADIPFEGYSLTGDQMVEALGKALQREVRLKPMAWWPLRLVQPVMPMVKGLFEMRYLWNTPHQLEPALFDQLLPGFEQTPLLSALQQATAHLEAAQVAPPQAVTA